MNIQERLMKLHTTCYVTILGYSYNQAQLMSLTGKLDLAQSRDCQPGGHCVIQRTPF